MKPGIHVGLRLGECLFYRFAGTGGLRFPRRCRRSIASLFLQTTLHLLIFLLLEGGGWESAGKVRLPLSRSDSSSKVDLNAYNSLGKDFPLSKDVSIAFPTKFLQLGAEGRGPCAGK